MNAIPPRNQPNPPPLQPGAEGLRGRQAAAAGNAGEGRVGGRQGGVGDGHNAGRARSACDVIKSIVSGLSNALTAVLRNSQALVKNINDYVIQPCVNSAVALAKINPDDYLPSPIKNAFQAVADYFFPPSIGERLERGAGHVFNRVFGN